MPSSRPVHERRAAGRPPARARDDQSNTIPASAVFHDWRASLSEQDLNHETIEKLASWAEYLESGGPPPDPLPLDASQDHVVQALQSFLRNTWREARLQTDGRIHDLRQTVADLVGITTEQAGMISSVRDDVHRLLHGIEDAYPDSEPVSEATSAVRKQLRDLETEAKKARAALNERLQELRTSLLARGTGMPDVVETDSEREIYFRMLCGAAHLFGENVSIVHFDFDGDIKACRNATSTVRSIFRRQTDVLCRVGDELSVIVIDTPGKQVTRLASESLTQLVDADISLDGVLVAAGVESAKRFSEAIEESAQLRAGDITRS